LYKFLNNDWSYVKSWTGGSTITIVDNLDSDNATWVLSARQGKVLKGLIDSLAADTYTKDEVNELLQNYAQLAAENIWTAYQNFSAGAGNGPRSALVSKNKLKSKK
jgi:hypothetical protein